MQRSPQRQRRWGSLRQVEMALDCFRNYSGEIDEKIAANERAAHEAYRAWEAQQRLLA